MAKDYTIKFINKSSNKEAAISILKNNITPAIIMDSENYLNIFEDLTSLSIIATPTTPNPTTPNPTTPNPTTPNPTTPTPTTLPSVQVSTPPIYIKKYDESIEPIECNISFEVSYSDGSNKKTVEVTSIPYLTNILDGLNEDKEGFKITPTYSKGHLYYGVEKTELQSGTPLQITSMITLYYSEK